MISATDLENLIRKHNGNPEGLRTALQIHRKKSRHMRTIRSRKRPDRVRLLRTSRTRDGGIVIPAGTIGRVIANYRDDEEIGLIAAFGNEFVRLPFGALAGNWERVE